jgi:aminoglycoside phosphotransferase (APT) family kinase protein
MTAASIESSTTQVRAGMELDAARLNEYLRDHVLGYEGPLSIRQFKGGQSNPTYLLSTPARRYVLRRKPPGQLLASAHAIDREFQVMSALGSQTSVPVARPYALCKDETVIGTWFYVMEHVDGRLFWDPSLPDITPAERPAYFDAMNAALAGLHQVNPDPIGLTEFGRASGYLARQIARWSKQYLEDNLAGRVPAMDLLTQWLPAHQPPSAAVAITHGDFRIDNLIFHPTEPRVAAILDWELSTIGDPLADLAYHLMMYRMPTLATPGLLGKDLDALNIPSEERYVEAYCTRTGRTGIDNLDYYLAFCMFRFAGILHGIRGRVVRGTAVSAQARDYARHVETIADLAWRQAERAMTAQNRSNSRK